MHWGLKSRSVLLAGLRRLAANLAILLVIAYLTLFGLILAERGRQRVPADPLGAAAEALQRTVAYLSEHPTTTYWHKENVPTLQLVATLFGQSAGLLLIALGVAIAIGVPLGISAALSRRKRAPVFVLLLSILGISMPSFLLAMLLWVSD